jgi:polyhydroxyalkanoate synthase subunit PhaC
MSDAKPPLPAIDFSLTDPVKMMANLSKLAHEATQLMQQYQHDPERLKKEADAQVVPMHQINSTLGAVMQAHLSKPEQLMEAQKQLWEQYTSIWNNAWARALGQPFETVAAPAKSDRRFKDKDWSENVTFDAVKQFYLVSAQWLQAMVQTAEVEPEVKQKAKFYVENIVNAFAPTNYLVSNPEALRATLSSSGENLLRGLEQFRKDMDQPDGRFRVAQVNKSKFRVGENVATTPGQVVFKNDVFELIQFTPQVARAHAVPLLIVPPWINKYYILDLTAEKSFIRFCVENGLTVFIMSWVNADETLGRKSFADYMQEGLITAMDQVKRATSQEKVNTVGFCIGGTLLASTLGYLEAKGDKRVGASTFLTTQVDFEKAGDLKVYVDEEQVKWIEGRMADKGYLPGARMAEAFNLLRSNDLLWSFAVNNYLLGKEPAPFDLLFWNSDSTRMPAGVHSFYLRECYLENKLSQGKMVLDNVRIDLARVKVPIYNLACREDHIAPLASVFRLARYFGGETTLVVSGSGHIAGVVNPPGANKYQHWTNPKPAKTVEDWMAGATEHAGSWWPHWLEWITARSGDKVPAPQPGDGALSVIYPAPGQYVRVSGIV